MANPQPTDAHLRVAHSINEAIMMRDFTKRQRKILDLILRLSWGCGRKEAYIPHQNDFCIVGLYEPDIKAELVWLEQSKIIIRQEMFYWFNKDFDQWQISRVKPFEPERLSKLLSLNLNGNRPELSKTLTKDLVKHEVNTSQNTKSATPTVGTPKERLKKVLKKGIYIIPDWIDKETWEAFLEVRKKRNVVSTDHALSLIVRDLEKLKASGDDPNEVLNKSITNSWKGVFPLKGVQSGANRGHFEEAKGLKPYTQQPDFRD